MYVGLTKVMVSRKMIVKVGERVIVTAKDGKTLWTCDVIQRVS